MAMLKKHRSSKKILAMSGVIYLILFVLVLVFSKGIGGKRLVINTTPSLPGHLYLLDENRKTLVKGNVVAVIVPQNPFSKNRNFLKQVWGVPNDNVSFDKLGNFFIDGELKGIAKKAIEDTQQPLIHSEPGIIKANHYFLGTPHKDSFDSRYIYIGNIHEKNIIGDASLIF